MKLPITFMVFLLYGLGMVLLYNGLVHLINDVLNITWAWSLALGFILVVTLVFFYKFRWLIK